METCKEAKCGECGITFVNKSNLRRHVKSLHPHKLNELAPKYLQVSSNFVFTCEICTKNFNHKKHLNFHMKTHNIEETGSVRIEDSKKCPLCIYETYAVQDIHAHFTNIHDININSEHITFSTLDEFNNWKTQVENGSNSKFVKHTSTSKNKTMYTYYTCHRSGNYNPKGKGLRHLKLKGSNKINAFCPSRVTISLNSDGKYIVHFIKTHVGHENDLGHLTLNQSERNLLAHKIASKIPFDTIIDEVANSIPTSSSDLKRMHLLTRKDLHNIESCFNLSSSAVRHSNDAISVEAWVTEMQKEGDCVLYYKAQGNICEQYPILKPEDFVLVIMTSAQCEFLRKYGTDCVCIDGTHGMNSYNFEMHTILVLDDLREGFPCAFLISNRADSYIMKLFFSKVKLHSGTILAKTFMTDIVDTYYNAWVEEMGVPDKRLFCTWHITRAWRKNVVKIKSQEKQTEVYRKLRTLLEERDPIAFEVMIKNFCTVFDPSTIEFIEYFKGHYLQKRECWAYCYRLNAGLNTNMNLERMHGVIKYIYLKGKKVKRLDKAISAIMRFVRDKLINRLIVTHRGKISNKIKEIRRRHKHSQLMHTNLITKISNGWEVASETAYEIYLIQATTKTCDYKLICSECSICIHNYSCSCMDSSIMYNICKHIHLLAKWMKENVTPTENVAIVDNLALDRDQDHADEIDDNVDSDDNHLYIHCTPNDEVRNILLEVGHKTDNYPLEDEKTKIVQNLQRQLDKIQSPTKLAIVKRFLVPLSPTLAAASSSITKLPKPRSHPPNSKIMVQRRLWSKKKKTKKRNDSLKRPTLGEKEKTAALLLNTTC